MHARRFPRLGMNVFGKLLWGILGVCVFVVGFVIFSPKAPPSPRRTVVIAGSPMVIWSCDTVNPGCVVITIPSSYVVDAVHGYGRYSLEALWRLGFIDRRGGTILSQSAAEVLGFSQAWFLGVTDANVPTVIDGVSYGKKMISVSNSVPFFFHRFRSDMPIGDYIALARQIASTPFDQITSIDLGNHPITQKQTLADGSVQNVISPDLVDSALNGVIEDTSVRREALTVAVYNTTDTPNLGNRAARLLSTFGIRVVTVGNTMPQVSTCTVTGSNGSLASHTALAIESLLTCHRRESNIPQTSDLIVNVGSEFASRYTP